MRTVKSPQMQIGQTDIADIHIDVTSRDDIPMILLGFAAYLYDPAIKKSSI